MNCNPEILFVDDELSAAKDYAKLVQDKLEEAVFQDFSKEYSLFFIR